MFCCEFCEISKSNFFTEHLWTTAFVVRNPSYHNIFGKSSLILPENTDKIQFALWYALLNACALRFHRSSDLCLRSFHKMSLKILTGTFWFEESFRFFIGSNSSRGVCLFQFTKAVDLFTILIKNIYLHLQPKIYFIYDNMEHHDNI